jgi:hypothetical protein
VVSVGIFSMGVEPVHGFDMLPSRWATIEVSGRIGSALNFDG